MKGNATTTSGTIAASSLKTVMPGRKFELSLGPTKAWRKKTPERVIFKTVEYPSDVTVTGLD